MMEDSYTDREVPTAHLNVGARHLLNDLMKNRAIFVQLLNIGGDRKVPKRFNLECGPIKNSNVKPELVFIYHGGNYVIRSHPNVWEHFPTFDHVLWIV